MRSTRSSRQSFLGADSEERIAACAIGIAGLGGGGSHVVQQLAHLGFQRFVIYDGDVVEDSNLNRLVGAKSADARAETPKLHIAKMMILGLQSRAVIAGFGCRWQEEPEPLRECQIVVGCVDSSATLLHLGETRCPHFPDDEVGDPLAIELWMIPIAPGPLAFPIQQVSMPAMGEFKSEM